MNKRCRELQQAILAKSAEAQAFMNGEAKDLDKAEAALNEMDQLRKELEIEERLAAEAKSEASKAEQPKATTKADGFKMIAKKLRKQALDDTEKALVYPGTSGESYLVPDDVRLQINELRKTYISAKDLLTVIQTDALTGAFNYESGTPAGLTAIVDGSAIATETNPTFVRKSFTITHYGKLIPISNILAGAEQASLMGYLNTWFVRNAILTENQKIFDTLKAGYNSGTPKNVAGWKALKKSINVDLDPACLNDGVIITNQSGFACLDEEEDSDGNPILHSNPATPTEKMFQGLRVVVFPDAQLPNLGSGATLGYPMIYGSVKAGANFIDYKSLEFATSSDYLFNLNQTALRVIEGFDVISTDTSAYVYGKFTATPASATA